MAEDTSGVDQGGAAYIFVSYCHDDSNQVYPELVWLRAQGFNVWYDQGIAPGSSWREEIATAIDECALFLMFVTPRSVKSEPCRGSATQSYPLQRVSGSGCPNASASSNLAPRNTFSMA